MRVDILTLFPAMFEGFLAESIPRIAQEKGALSVHLHALREYTTNKHGKVDDKPFGGGPGMVLCCQPVLDAVRAIQAMDPTPGRLFFMSPEGRPLRQAVARELATVDRLILVCGRYEGFDQRIFDILQPEVLSLGDFVLSGGEIAAAAVVDAVARLLPGVVGDAGSLERESFEDLPESQAKQTGAPRLLDYPHYTQPAEYEGHTVPEILRSGDHGKIAAWRHEQARARTRKLRPDLLRDDPDRA